MVMCLEKAGFECSRLLKQCCCFAELPLVQKHVAQVVVHLGDVRPQRKQLAIGGGCLGQPPSAMFALGQGSESIQAGGLAGRRADRRHRVLSSLTTGNSDSA